MIHPDLSEPKADILNHYDIFLCTLAQHGIWIQQIAGSMYKVCVFGQVRNISELNSIICKMGVLLPTSWWPLSI